MNPTPLRIKPFDAIIAMLSVPGVSAPAWVIGTCTSVESAAAYIRDPLDRRRIGPIAAMLPALPPIESPQVRDEYAKTLRTSDASKRIKDAIGRDAMAFAKGCKQHADAMEAFRNGMPLDEIIADIGGRDARLREWEARLAAATPVRESPWFTVSDASGLDDSEARAPERPSADLPSARVTTMSTVVRERINWLWRARFARGLLNLLDGDPGVGKSTITIDLTARVTTGQPMPLETERSQPADVLLIGAEDHLAATVLPRLEAARADLARVHVLEAVPREGDPDAPPTLADVAEIERVVTDKKCALVVIDPLMAHLPSGTDAHRDSDMRGVLAPLAAMAQRTGVAIVIVRHLRKMGGPAIYRGSSSIGIIGAARSALLVGKDPDDPDTCILAHAKGNLAPPPPSIRYRVVDSDGVGRIEWMGTADVSADRLAALSDPNASKEEDAREPVREALRRVLANGEVSVAEVNRDVIAMTGTSTRTIERAREDLEIKSAKRGKTWVLYLPGGGHETCDFGSSPPTQFGGGVDEKPYLTTRDYEGMKSATSTGGVDAGGVDYAKSATTTAPGGVARQSEWSPAVFADARYRGLHEDDE